MTEIKLEELSNEELLKREKMIITVTYTLAGMLLLLFGLGIFLTFKKGFTALTVVPIALLPIVIINFGNIKKIKAERKLRNL
ncbi:redox-active disulfide protein 2 [Pedobacter fastidiosus]|uniref:Redox-active disulfide protein 2 n=1 Tax=Pedobacter fastidiosus TaxID=2765361 RepID=A0ABR7KQ59_9SPHI|nr:redox-active disulfide protein 2 [Pedobacter fastidiosus]MBC6110220.1 redox-active disulfide protein 2 [Pedobacter fastidiosus]